MNTYKSFSIIIQTITVIPKLRQLNSYQIQITYIFGKMNIFEITMSNWKFIIRTELEQKVDSNITFETAFKQIVDSGAMNLTYPIYVS